MRLVLTTFISTCLLLACNESTKDLSKNEIEIQQVMTNGFKFSDNGEYDSAVYALKKALKIPGSPEDRAMCANGLANLYYKHYHYPEAIEYYLQSIDYFNQAGDTVNCANAKRNAGLCFKQLEMYDRATEYLNDALLFFSKDTQYTSQAIMVHTTLGNIFKEIENFNIAREHQYEALRLLELNPKLSQAPVLNNIGRLHSAQGNIDSANWYLKHYLELARKENKTKRIGRAYQNLALNYLKVGDYQKTRLFLDSSQRLYSSLSYSPGILSQHIAESEYALYHNIDSALLHAQIAIKMALILSKPNERLRAIELVEQIHREKAQYQQALDVSDARIALEDSLKNQKVIGQIYTHEMIGRVAQERAKTESEKQKRKYERRLRYGMMVLVLLSLILALEIYRRYMDKKRFVQEYFSSKTGVILKSGKKVEYDDILRVETIRNDLVIVKVNKEKVIEKNTTLKSFIPSLPKIQFGRPQRGIVINYKLVTKVWKTKLDLLEESINISDKYRDDFMDSWKKFQNTNR